MNEAIVAAALLAGMLLAVQAAANVQLTKALGNAFAAASLQLSVGTIVLFASVLTTHQLFALGGIAHAAPWHLIGGLGSALFVTAGIVLVPRLGATATLGVFIAGQLAASTLLDTFGMLGVHRHVPGGFELLGLAAVGVSTTLIVRAGWNATTVSPRLLALGIIAGAALPIQGAINAQLRLDLGAPLAVALVSFAVAALTMIMMTLVTLRVAAKPRLSFAALATIPWWGWLGGVMGAAYVTTVFSAIPLIGASAVIGLTIAGQQLAAVLADQFAWLRLPRRPATLGRIGGVVGLVGGALAVQFLR